MAPFARRFEGLKMSLIVSTRKWNNKNPAKLFKIVLKSSKKPWRHVSFKNKKGSPHASSVALEAIPDIPIFKIMS